MLDLPGLKENTQGLGFVENINVPTNILFFPSESCGS